MRIQAATKYRLANYYRLLGIFFLYWLFFSIVLPGVFAISANAPIPIGNPLISAFIYSGIATLFVTSKGLKFLFQNGVSRKTMFISSIITIVLGSLSLLLVSDFFQYLTSKLPFIHVIDDFTKIYGHHFHSDLSNSVIVFVLGMMIMIAFSSIFLLLGTLFSVITKTQKMIFMGLLIFIPSLLVIAFQQLNTDTWLKLLDIGKYVIGMPKHSLDFTPFHPMLFSFLIFLICSIFYYLLVSTIQLNMLKED
ncbi:hypothetical protein D920_01024 [Enterococcus faecalis 13-SD-W-01]|nr:hypothetical protein D920_01024 [Enterococcus faecalis 13-SD-W-01]